MINAFDADILDYLNQFAQHSRGFDTIVAALSSQALLKGWVLVCLFWWVWFDQGEDNAANRETIIATCIAAVLAVAAGRLLANYLPFRVRPLQSPELAFVLPYGVAPDALRSWSSFPSDHAMVFFAMSAGLWYVSKTLGAAVSVYVAIVIALPRIYLGFHYPSDIIGGAVLGVLFAVAANWAPVKHRLAAPALRWVHAHPASFYATFVLFSQGLATLFDAVRHLTPLWRSP